MTELKGDLKAVEEQRDDLVSQVARAKAANKMATTGTLQIESAESVPHSDSQHLLAPSVARSPPVSPSLPPSLFPYLPFSLRRADVGESEGEVGKLKSRITELEEELKATMASEQAASAKIKAEIEGGVKDLRDKIKVRGFV